MSRLTTLVLLGALIIVVTIVLLRSSQPSAHQPGQDESPRLPAIGATAEIKLPFYGCEKSEDLGTIVALVQQDDALAAARYARLHCIELKAGGKGKVEDISLSSMQVCLRPPGDDRCYWTRREMLADYKID